VRKSTTVVMVVRDDDVSGVGGQDLRPVHLARISW